MLALILLLSPAPQAPRDGTAARPVTGTSTLSGIVVTDDADGRPVRRARVSVTDGERRAGATTITDDAGRFLLRNVAAGRYTITAAKNAWVGRALGAARPGRPGTPLVVRDGEHIGDIVLRIARGAVITGTITDEAGRPLVGRQVTTFRYAFLNGARTLVPGGMGAQSDDQGVYRVYGLAPGEYLVGAPAVGVGMPAGELVQTTDAAISQALGSNQANSRAPGGDDAPQTVAYASVFYPGTSLPSQAAAITLAPGEERAGVDFAVPLVPTSRIEGSVVHPDGAPAADGMVNLVASGSAVQGFTFGQFRTARTGAEGRFTFAGLQPGKYTVIARATATRDGAAPAAARPGAAPPALSAMADVVLDGHALTGLALTLSPGVTVSGRVAFSGGSPLPDPARLRVSLTPAVSAGQVGAAVSPATVDADGTFEVTGVTPGAYRLSAFLPGVVAGRPGWALKTATTGGVDVLEVPFDVRQDVKDLLLTFTDRPGELTGLLKDPAGQPALDYFVMVFPADPARWTSQSRRIRAVRPSSEGRFSIRDLPAGEYLLAAVSDLEPGEWTDPAVLQSLSSGAMKLTLGDGEHKQQDVQINR